MARIAPAAFLAPRLAPVWVVAVLAAVWSVADAVHRPAQVALMTTVVRTPGQLGAANALWGMVDNGGFLAASLVVGVSLAVAGIAEAFAVTALVLVVAVVALLGVPADPPLPALNDAGVDIVRQGEEGNALFVIEHGEVDVFEHEVHRRVEGPGEHFGEIALLRDVPRTATVRAKSDVSVLVLDRPEFLAAVGSYRRARVTLDEVASSRLGVPDEAN